MNLINRILHRRKEPVAKWSEHPQAEGWYVSYRKGAGMDIFYWSGGDDDPCFEPQKNTRYFGPFRLPV